MGKQIIGVDVDFYRETTMQILIIHVSWANRRIVKHETLDIGILYLWMIV